MKNLLESVYTCKSFSLLSSTVKHLSVLNMQACTAWGYIDDE